MLKSTTPYLAILKVSSGDEVIGEIVEETSEHILVKNPLVFVQTPQGVQFAPFMIMADMSTPVKIPKPVISAKPSDAVETPYRSATSGIALPQAKSIITN